ncbi:hypothetical protein I204_03617 [Kwoniella mangroviensis CBS 8886]|nr:hypothetical protein I204_03617 [Kwoniella mangroviensis CBS 8886]
MDLTTEAQAKKAMNDSYSNLPCDYEISNHTFDNILQSSTRKARLILDVIETMQNLFLKNIGSHSAYNSSATNLYEMVKGDTDREQQVLTYRARTERSVNSIKEVHVHQLNQVIAALTPWAIQTLTRGSEIGSRYIKSLNDRETSIEDSRQAWMTAKQDIDRFKPTITRCASTTRNDDTHEMTRAYQGWKSTLDEVERVEMSCYKAIH